MVARLTVGLALALAPGLVVAAEPPPTAPAPAPSREPGPYEVPPTLDLSKVPDDGPVLTLPDAIQQTVGQNYDLAASRERIAQAEASLRRAWGGVEPVATTALTYTLNNKSAVFPFPLTQSVQPTQNQANGSPVSYGDTVRLKTESVQNIVIQEVNQVSGLLDLRQPIFVMPAFLSIASARQAVEASTATVQEIRDSTLLSVAQTYYAALSAKRLIALSQLLLEATQEDERAAGARFEVGQTAKVEVLRAGVQRAQAEQNLVAARNQYAAAKASLESLTGIHLPFQVTPPPPVQIPQVGVDEAVKTGLESRAAIRASDLQESIAHRGLRSAWWEFAPTVSLDARGLYSNATGFTGQSIGGLVQIVAAWTIYDGGRYADLDNARSVVRQAEAQAGSTRSSVVREVRTALYDLETARASLLAAKEQVGLAKENARLVVDRYQSGVARYLDVIDANNAAFGAGVNVVTNEANVETSALALRRAMGKLGLASGG